MCAEASPTPYEGLPPRAFWRTGIAQPSPLELHDIYRPRFAITRTTPIAAAGSCFAQHIGRQFKQRGYRFLDVESPPPFLDEARRHAYGYDMYSARYGNVYSIRQMRQLLDRANGSFEPIERVWQDGSRFYDPFRPNVEPGGFDSAEAVLASQRAHLAAVHRLFGQADLVVFTFGLTEGWVNSEDGAVFPTCPGTVAGRFDPQRHAFHNFGFVEVLEDAEAVIAMIRERRPGARFLFTVSPVPLTATASGGHVLPSTIYSKSVLRAVCGELVQRHEGVDYFPSYELVASHPMRAMFFEPNLRSVAASGVRHVMSYFFDAHGDASVSDIPATSRQATPAAVPAPDEDDVICEELALEQYS